MSLLASVAKLGSANIVLLAAQALTVLLLGVIAPAEEFAIFLLGLTTAQIFVGFAAFRFDSAIPSASSRRELMALLILSAASICMISLLVFLGVIGLSSADLFEMGNLPSSAAAIVALITTFLATAQLGRLWAVRHGELHRIEKATIVRAILTVVLRGVILILLFAAPTAEFAMSTGVMLLMAEMLITFTTASILAPRIDLHQWFGSANKATLLAAARRNWKFPLLETPSTALNSIAINAPIYLVTHFFGLAATASYGLAYRLIAVPVGQLALAMTEVMQSRYSLHLRNREWSELTTLFKRSSLLLLSGGILVCAIAFLLVEAVIVGVTDEKMREFAQICVVISPWVAAIFAVNTNSRLLPLLKRQELKLFYDFYLLASILLIYFVQSFYSLPFISFVALISGSAIIGYSIYWIMIWVAVRQADRRG